MGLKAREFGKGAEKGDLRLGPRWWLVRGRC